MPNCECLENCPFFQDRMANMPGTTEMIKRRLCQNDNDACARYLVFKQAGPGSVPGNLFPNELDKAQAFINGFNKGMSLEKQADSKKAIMP